MPENMRPGTLYILVCIQHDCLTKEVSALHHNNSVIKGLWCNFFAKDIRCLQAETRQQEASIRQ